MTLFYQLGMSGGDLDVDVTINGFPLHAGELAGSLGTVLNPFLVGKGNQLKFAFGRRGAGAEFQGALQTVKEGEMVSTLASGEFKLSQANEITHSFDSETAGFAAILDAAQPVTGESLLPFALKIRDLLRTRNTNGLMKLFEPKLQCYAEAFGAPLSALQNDIASGLREFLDSDLKFEATDLVAQPWCGGKVHLLARKDGTSLVHKPQGDGSLSMHVYAAMLADGPAIVA